MLRFATEKDLQSLAEMNKKLIEDEEHDNPMSIPELKLRMADWLQTEYQAVVFLAGTEIAGYALFQDNLDSIYLRHFYVERKFRRQGIGRKSIAALITSVWAPGRRVACEVLIHNRRGIDFWRGVGFRDYSITMDYQPTP